MLVFQNSSICRASSGGLLLSLNKLKRHVVDHATAGSERIILAYGMRRSGNHALMHWLVNALEGRPSGIEESANFHRFAWSDSGQSFLINDLAVPSSKNYRRQLWLHRNLIRSARFIVFSAEDRTSDILSDWRMPSRGDRIAVQRDTLNLLASRFQRLQQCARKGIADRSMEMRGHFFETLKTQLHHTEGTVWSFEKWLTDPDWRSRFLAELGLSEDITPGIATEGGGSSFTGVTGTPASEELRSRFRMIEPAAPWKHFLSGVALQYPELFNAADHDIIKQFVN